MPQSTLHCVWQAPCPKLSRPPSPSPSSLLHSPSASQARCLRSLLARARDPDQQPQTMASAVVYKSCAGVSRTWTSDGCRQELFSGNLDLSMSKLVSTRRPLVISAAVRSASEAPPDLGGRYGNACFDQPCALSCPISPVIRDVNLERWVEESVHEIVKNIKEAPFLHYVFVSRRGRFGRSQRQKISQDLFKTPNYWPSIRESLSKVNPDGVILVQKLEPGLSSTCCIAEAFAEEMVCPLQAEGTETNVWGVLVQAKGVHANACYLLKTTRVPSPAGWITRYCLTKAKCFGPSYAEQLENAWLL